MRVTYKVCREYGKRGAVVGYEQTGPTIFCCKEMCEEWGLLVGFGVKGHPVTTNCTVNVFTIHPQTYTAPIIGITAIRHCPWCGEPIQVERIGHG